MKASFPAGSQGLDIASIPSAASEAKVETVIRANPGWIAVDWSELVQSHELFYTLIARDLMVRYKQTVLGVAWAVIQPIFTMLVFTIIFGRMLKVETAAPYPLFCYAALVPWLFFTNSVNSSALSLLNNQNLLTKIYFPRLYVPASVVGGFLVDMLIALGLFAFLMPYYHYSPSWSLLALPIAVALAFVTSLGAGLVLAALTILYRDLRFVIPFVLQLMMYISAVIVPLDKLPRSYQYLAALNPMYGVVGAFRSSILGLSWDLETLAISMVSMACLLAFGISFFRRTERLMADII